MMTPRSFFSPLLIRKKFLQRSRAITNTEAEATVTAAAATKGPEANSDANRTSEGAAIGKTTISIACAREIALLH